MNGFARCPHPLFFYPVEPLRSHSTSTSTTRSRATCYFSLNRGLTSCGPTKVLTSWSITEGKILLFLIFRLQILQLLIRLFCVCCRISFGNFLRQPLTWITAAFNMKFFGKIYHDPKISSGAGKIQDAAVPEKVMLSY